SLLKSRSERPESPVEDDSWWRELAVVAQRAPRISSRRRQLVARACWSRAASAQNLRSKATGWWRELAEVAQRAPRISGRRRQLVARACCSRAASARSPQSKTTGWWRELAEDSARRPERPRGAAHGHSGSGGLSTARPRSDRDR